MKIDKKASFINELSLKLTGKNDLGSRTLMAITTGQLAGKFMGSFLPWGIVIYDGFFRKKPTSIKNFGDYMIFKTSAALMNPSEIEHAFNFAKEKYQLLEPYLENLTNYF